MKRGMFGEKEMAMQLEDEDLSMASVYDRISRPSSKIKQTLPFLSLMCPPTDLGCKRAGRGLNMI